MVTVFVQQSETLEYLPEINRKNRSCSKPMDSSLENIFNYTNHELLKLCKYKQLLK